MKNRSETAIWKGDFITPRKYDNKPSTTIIKLANAINRAFLYVAS